MEVNEKTAKFKTEYKGKTYYFCAEMCKKKFVKDPKKFVKCPIRDQRDPNQVRIA